MNAILYTNPEIIGIAIGWAGLWMALRSERKLRDVLTDMDTRLRWLELRDEADLNSEDD